MNIRIARKIVSNPYYSKRLHKTLKKLYPPYYNEQGHYCMPSIHKYYRFMKAWTIVERKRRKYQEKFKRL